VRLPPPREGSLTIQIFHGCFILLPSRVEYIVKGDDGAIPSIYGTSLMAPSLTVRQMDCGIDCCGVLLLTDGMPSSPPLSQLLWIYKIISHSRVKSVQCYFL
jgi:hypothetical protein